MCGIAGFLMEGGRAADPSLIRHMCDRIAHRGPDGFGSFHLPNVALGHRRLSIIDLSGGAQPLGNEDDSIQIVFNGEIYNYRELRAGLIERGHVFRTQSDTEVIVHLYEEQGERTPEVLNGMFAFAIWDGGRRELFLARDRFGKKPVYYSTSIPGFACAFASEIKSLTLLPGFPAAINTEAVSDFLALGYVPDPDSIYRSVSKLPPAHTLTFSGSGTRLRRYWNAGETAGEEWSEASAAEELRQLAGDAVARRMISDVPLGGFLSGGVDSSAVVALMAGRAPGRVKTFSIGFTVKQYDELEYARLVATRYGTDHHEETVSPSIDDVFDTLVEHFDEPFGDASAIPTLYLARMTRRHVTVALSGDGADELFGGYRRYYFGALEEKMKAVFPRWFRRPFFSAAGRFYPKLDFLPRVFRAKTLLGNLALEIGDSYFHSVSIFRDTDLRRLLAPPMRSGYSPQASFRSRFAKYSHLPPLQQMQAVDLETYLPGDILVKVDRASMAHSLEARSPWLDYRIGEFSFRLPAALKIKGRTGKFLFKSAFQDLIPGPILHRPKMGFATPLAQWFRSRLRPVFENAVLNGGMEDFLVSAEVRRLWREHQSGIANHERKLWNLLLLAAWKRRFLDGDRSSLMEDRAAVALPRS